MRLCFASAYHLSAYYGGNEHYAHHLATGITLSGHQLTYLTGSFKKTVKMAYPVTICRSPVFFNYPLPSYSWILPLTKIRPQLFHAAGSGLPLLFQAWWLKRHLPDTPRFLTFQADSLSTKLISRLGNKLENLLIPQVFTDVIATTPRYQQLLQRRWPNVRVHFVPLFISNAFLKPNPSLKPNKLKKLPPGSLRLLFVGQLDRHHYYKGLHVLINSLSLLPSAYHLTVIGTGPLLPQYRHLAKKLKVNSRCSFLGFIPHEKLPPYFKSADLFVLPSTSASEGFGMVLLESMVMKTPTIMTEPIGSASWFKSTGVTYMTQANNPTALANTIKRAVNHPSPGLVGRAYKLAIGLTQKQMVIQTLKLYQNAL